MAISRLLISVVWAIPRLAVTDFAVKLANTLNANRVSTDDVAWWLDPIHLS